MSTTVKRRRTTRQKPGTRTWVTRSMKVEHYNRLRVAAAHLPKQGRDATMEAAHSLVMELGLPLLEKRLGITAPRGG